MRVFDIEEVKERFEELIEEAANGNPFIISVGGVPKVVVIPIE